MHVNYSSFLFGYFLGSLDLKMKLLGQRAWTIYGSLDIARGWL